MISLKTSAIRRGEQKHNVDDVNAKSSKDIELPVTHDTQGGVVENLNASKSGSLNNS